MRVHTGGKLYAQTINVCKFYFTTKNKHLTIQRKIMSLGLFCFVENKLAVLIGRRVSKK
jgi:hypothetical protein